MPVAIDGVRTPVSLPLPKHAPIKNAPDFTLPNRDAPKTRPVLGLNLRRCYFRGVCFCAPTRIRAKFGGFHFSLHGYAQNQPYFRPKPLTRSFSGRMQYAPTRVRAKFGGFHISAHGCAKNAPDFTHPNRDMPKSCPVLAANSCRRTFWGVCNTPLHGYMKNLTGFIFPHTT